MWRHAAGVALCVGPAIPAASRSVIKTDCGKTIPLLYQRNERIDNDAGEFELLFVRRSKQSGFMGGVYALPGGLVDKADFSNEWKNIIKGTEYFTTSCPSLPIYIHLGKEDFLPAQVALRICAIRELFEETGVLLAKTQHDMLECAQLGTVAPSVFSLNKTLLLHWREKVHKDANNFIAMCQEFNCSPDVYSLIEWSNWLTPWKFKRRYDAVFYQTCLKDKPIIEPDQLEISEACWKKPSDMLSSQYEGTIKLSPPLFSDLSLMTKLPSISLLHTFCVYSSVMNSIFRNVSVRIKCTDGSVLLCGLNDTLYPPTDQTMKCSTGYEIPLSRNDIAQFIINDDHSETEYICTTHSTTQLQRLSSKKNRAYMPAPELLMKMTLDDNITPQNLATFLRNYSKQS